jgi:hypothetical protein
VNQVVILSTYLEPSLRTTFKFTNNDLKIILQATVSSSWC